MGRLLVLMTLVIVYGSLYPFRFASDPPGLDALLALDPWSHSRGDIVSNLALFVPFGLFAMALRGMAARLAALAAGIGLAVLVQVAQLYLPMRDPSLDDVVWNAAGLFLGAAVSRPVLGRIAAAGQGGMPVAPIPILLIGAWLGYLLVPYVPSLDLQEIVDLVKEMMESGWSARSLARHTLAWCVVFALARQVRGIGSDDRLALAAAFGAVLLQFVIVDRGASWASLIGPVSAMVLWWGGLRWLGEGAAWVLVPLLAIQILADGLTGGGLRARPAPFLWVPFAGILSGNPLINLAAILHKLFLYGSILWLCGRSRAGLGRAVIALAVLLAGIEAAQIHLAGRTPEITDPLLAGLLGVAFLPFIRTRRAYPKPCGAGRPARAVRPGPAPPR